MTILAIIAASLAAVFFVLWCIELKENESLLLANERLKAENERLKEDKKQ